MTRREPGAPSGNVAGATDTGRGADDTGGGAAPLVDAEARRRALEDLDTTLLVEAAAGSGKTTLLLGRIVALVRSGRARLSEIAAVTFTEKAAAELRMRLRAALERAGLQEALRDLEAARIGTIHGFAGTLLRERPVEAGVDPGFTVADPLTASLLLDATWERWLPASLSDPGEGGSVETAPIAAGHATGATAGATSEAASGEAASGERASCRAAVQRAIELGVSLDTLRDLAFALVDERDRLDGLPGPAPEPEPPARLNADLRAEIGRLEAIVAESVKRADDRMALAIAALGDWARQTAGLPEADQVRALIESAPFPDKTATLGAKTKWRDPLRLQECRDALGAAYARVQAARAAARHDLVVALARWARGFVDAYQARKARSGVLDFHDLLLRARDLVRDRPDVRRDFRRRIRYLLVDEFQDTDPLQLEMILALADGAAPGSLFIVGDPKQSIYRFRRADIETYEAAKGEIAARGAVLEVRANFRSDGALLEAINGVFDGVMVPPPDGAYQPAYVPLEPSPRTRPGVPPVVLGVAVPAPEDGPPSRILVADGLAAEARTLARWLREEAGAGRLQYGHVAILFRAMTAVALYEDALREAAVPFRTVGGRHYYDRSEVGWVIACLSAIEDPHDPVALVGALRSPFFGLSDADLLALRRAGAEWSYLRDLPPAAPEPARPAWTILRELHDLRNAVAPPALVAELYVRTQVLAAYALDPQGEARVANLLKVLDTARALEATGVLTFRGFVRWLAARGAARYEEEESALEGEGAVRLMSVHRAKGLEFPVVVVADLGREGRPGVRRTLVDRRSGRVELHLGQVDDEPLQTLGWEEAEAAEAVRADAEALRLLYVALTRAEERLVLPMPAGAPPGSFAFYLGGLLGDADEAAEPPSESGSEGEGLGGSRSVRASSVVRRGAEASDSALVPGFVLDLPRSPTGAGSRAGESLADWRTARRALLTRAGAPSMAVVRPSTITAADRGAGDGDGRRLGALVHAALAAVDLKRPDEAPAVVAALGARRGAPPDLVTAAVRRVRRALGSPVLARAQRATWVAREWPVTAEVDGVLVDGRVDLVFEEGGGLVVVEFKVEGDPVDPADAAEQARLYAQAVARATGRPVRETLVVSLSG